MDRKAEMKLVYTSLNANKVAEITTKEAISVVPELPPVTVVLGPVVVTDAVVSAFVDASVVAEFSDAVDSSS